MSDKEIKPVEVGQVYRDKDARFIRFVLVASINSASHKARCVPCDSSGKPLRRGLGRATEIRTSNLQKRFELVREE